MANKKSRKHPSEGDEEIVKKIVRIARLLKNQLPSKHKSQYVFKNKVFKEKTSFESKCTQIARFLKTYSKNIE